MNSETVSRVIYLYGNKLFFGRGNAKKFYLTPKVTTTGLSSFDLQLDVKGPINK